MPVRFRTDPESGFTLFLIADALSLVEFARALHQYQRQGLTRLELYDFRRYTGDFFSMDDLQRLSDDIQRRLPQRPPGSMTALLTPNPLSYGASRQFQALAAFLRLPWETEVFTVLEDACRWLGIAPEVVVALERGEAPAPS